MSLRTVTVTGVAIAFGGLLQATGCAVSSVDSAAEESVDGSVTQGPAAKDAAAANDSGKTPVPDSGRPPVLDSGTPDATTRPDGGGTVLDAGPTSPVTGTACTTVGAIYTKTCGLCGTQEAACEADNKVGAYGVCNNEVVGGCMPATTRSSACGICGTRMEICQNNCKYAAGSCTGELVGGCSPGAVKTTTAGCSVAGEVRSQVCGATCTFGAPGACAAPVIPSLSISRTVGTTVNADFALTPLTDQLEVIDNYSTCPETISTVKTSYSWIKLVNPGTTPATVTVWGSRATGATVDLDTVSAWYNRTTIPMTAAEREACNGYSNDTCADTPCDITADYAGFIDDGIVDERVTVPASSFVIIYTGAYDSADTGSFKLNARTDAL